MNLSNILILRVCLHHFLIQARTNKTTKFASVSSSTNLSPSLPAECRTTTNEFSTARPQNIHNSSHKRVRHFLHSVILTHRFYFALAGYRARSYRGPSSTSAPSSAAPGEPQHPRTTRTDPRTNEPSAAACRCSCARFSEIQSHRSVRPFFSYV